jgi:hypothetical protein
MILFPAGGRQASRCPESWTVGYRPAERLEIKNAQKRA